MNSSVVYNFHEILNVSFPIFTIYWEIFSIFFRIHIIYEFASLFIISNVGLNFQESNDIIFIIVTILFIASCSEVFMWAYTAIVVQLLLLLLSIMLVTFVFLKVSTVEQNSLTLMTQSAFMMCVGNTIFLLNESPAGALIGLNIMFFGAGFISFCYVLQFSDITRQEIRTPFKIIMATINMFFVGVGIFDQHFKLLYKDIRIIRRGPINVYEYKAGWLFYIYVFWELGYCLHAFFCTVRCKKETPALFHHLKKALIEFTICGAVALIPYLLSLPLACPIVIAPWSCTLATFLFVFGIYRWHVYPVRRNSQETVLNGLNDMILVVNSSGCFEYANEMMLVTVPSLRFIPYNYQLKGFDPKLDSLLEGEDGKEISIGESLYDRLSLTVRISGKDTGIIYWFRDVTKETLYIRRILQLKDEADRANAAKTTFLAHVSHEIRTPINAVLGMDELILRETAEVNTREYADQIMRAGKTLLALINDILDSSKIEAGKMEIIEDSYDFRRMIDDVIMMTHFRADSKKLLLNSRIAEDMPVSLIGDETRVKQIITNIMTNAVKYTEQGSVSLNVGWSPVENDLINVLIDVSDTGIGIANEDLPKLFGRFERIENKTTHATEGTGLGMNITTSLLELMHGTISVESTVGVGSTFHISIPQRVTANAGRHPFTAPDARILIVDDNVPNLTIATALLKDTKIRIDHAKSGADFIAVIQKKHYDLIFLDQRMPGMDGLEAFHATQGIEHLCKDTPIVMMTADSGADMRSFYKKEGLTDYIAKPLIPEDYERMVSELLPPEKVTYI